MAEGDGCTGQQGHWVGACVVTKPCLFGERHMLQRQAVIVSGMTCRHCHTPGLAHQGSTHMRGPHAEHLSRDKCVQFVYATTDGPMYATPFNIPCALPACTACPSLLLLPHPCLSPCTLPLLPALPHRHTTPLHPGCSSCWCATLAVRRDVGITDACLGPFLWAAPPSVLRPLASCIKGDAWRPTCPGSSAKLAADAKQIGTMVQAVKVGCKAAEVGVGLLTFQPTH